MAPISTAAAALASAVLAGCQHVAAEDDGPGDEAAAGSADGCDDGSSCSEGDEQGLGMMLSEYILQMHTTPVACNSVSGALGPGSYL
jgi:hypothetical protein